MLKLFTYALLLVIVGYFSFSAGESVGTDKVQVVEKTAVNEERGAVVELAAEKTALPDVVERVLPTVVGIEASDGRYASNSTVSLGSGVIMSDMGYIVTNQHVVGEKPYRIAVTLYDGSIREGYLCWSDKTLDVAVIRIRGNMPAVAVMGEYESIRVGEDVFAIGNPLSLQFERSVTKGIVSALNRTITINSDNLTTYMEDLIQTDASINPGNSGGPLMNVKGEVIGINTIRVQSAEGMGFAVPINICESVISSLEETGTFETPYLGLYAFTSQTAKYLKKENSGQDGLFVISLDTKGPAYKGGVKYGDMITKINGIEVTDMLSLRRELFKCPIGEEIILTLLSGNTRKDVSVTVGKMNNNYIGVNQ